jgi:hypothetical protein
MSEIVILDGSLGAHPGSLALGGCAPRAGRRRYLA